MKLGRKAHGAGNHIRYVIDYSSWLEDGESLTAGTVVMTPAYATTITDITLAGVTTTPSNDLVFIMSGGSANEVFTLDVQIVNSRGEIKNDTVEFYVVAP